MTPRCRSTTFPLPAAGLRAGATLRVAVTSLVAIVWLSGCAAPGRLPAVLPCLPASAAGWVDGQTADVASVFPNARWWTAPGDPALDALVDQALAGQPSLAVAAARLARASAGVDALAAGQGPQAALGLDITRQRYTEHGLVPPPLAGGSYTLANLQASASIEFDFFGRHQAVLGAALGQQRAASANLQAARVLLAAQVAQAYVGLARLAHLQGLAEQTTAQRQAAHEVADASASLQSLARQQAEQAPAWVAAESAFDLALQRYRAGLDNYLPMLAAQTGVLAQRTQAAELTARALDGQVVLARALGGGWQDAENTPGPAAVATPARLDPLTRAR